MTLICFILIQNLVKLRKYISSELSKLLIWFRANKLSFNDNFFYYMLFGNKRIQNPTNKKFDSCRADLRSIPSH